MNESVVEPLVLTQVIQRAAKCAVSNKFNSKDTLKKNMMNYSMLVILTNENRKVLRRRNKNSGRYLMHVGIGEQVSRYFCPVMHRICSGISPFLQCLLTRKVFFSSDAVLINNFVDLDVIDDFKEEEGVREICNFVAFDSTKILSKFTSAPL